MLERTGNAHVIHDAHTYQYVNLYLGNSASGSQARMYEVVKQYIRKLGSKNIYIA